MRSRRPGTSAKGLGGTPVRAQADDLLSFFELVNEEPKKNVRKM
jgi:hypothetical protein